MNPRFFDRSLMWMVEDCSMKTEIDRNALTSKALKAVTISYYGKLRIPPYRSLRVIRRQLTARRILREDRYWSPRDTKDSLNQQM